MTTHALTVERNGGSALPPAAAPATPAVVDPAVLARWSSALSRDLAGAGDDACAAGAAATTHERPTIGVAAETALAEADSFDDGLRESEPVGDTIIAAHQRAPARPSPEPHAQERPRAGASGEEPATGTAAASLSLRELRARHHGHREAPFDADVARADSARTARDASKPLEPRGEAAVLGVTIAVAMPADQPGVASSAGASEPLQSLIESCCSRMWVADGGDRAAPRGVMLDLGGWMPGCTLEVARVAGGLRIVMRGVQDDRRVGLERELDDLSAGLAEKIGCPVVAAVESRGALR